MPLGYGEALRLLHQTFRHQAATQRFHILGRFLTAPFLRSLDVIPEGASVLDIGAGHGTYARLLAEDRRARVVALEPDLRKTLLSYRHPAIRFVAGFDTSIRGSFDVVVLYDVFYRFPPSERDALLARVFDRIRRGGSLILKDIDPSQRIKHQWNRAQETLADWIGLSLGRQFESESIQSMTERVTRAGFSGLQWKRIGFGYPHAHILYVARRP